MSRPLVIMTLCLMLAAFMAGPILGVDASSSNVVVLRLEIDHYVWYKGDNYIILDSAKYENLPDRSLPGILSRLMEGLPSTPLTEEEREAIRTLLVEVLGNSSTVTFWLRVAYVRTTAAENLALLEEELARIARDHEIGIVMLVLPINQTRQADLGDWRVRYEIMRSVARVLDSIVLDVDARSLYGVPGADSSEVPRLLSQLAGTVNASYFSSGGYFPYSITWLGPMLHVQIYVENAGMEEAVEVVKYLRDKANLSEEIPVLFSLVPVKHYYDPLVEEIDKEVTATTTEEPGEAASTTTRPAPEERVDSGYTCSPTTTAPRDAEATPSTPAQTTITQDPVASSENGIETSTKTPIAADTGSLEGGAARSMDNSSITVYVLPAALVAILAALYLGRR